MRPMLPSLLGSIIWPIALIWQFKHYQYYLWWCTLKICCNVYTPILHIHLKGTWSSQNFQNSWQYRGTKFSEMSRQDGFQHWTPLKKLCQDTKLWRWPWITLQANKLCCIMITFVTFRLWLNLFAFCHCWNLCMLSSNLHNLHMYLCVIWWQQSRFVNMIFIVCIMIKFPSYYRQLPCLQIIVGVQAWKHLNVLNILWSSTFWPLS